MTVAEERIAEAMRLAWEIIKIVIEPSAAVPMAALLERRLAVDDEARILTITFSGVDTRLKHQYWNIERVATRDHKRQHCPPFG